MHKIFLIFTFAVLLLQFGTVSAVRQDAATDVREDNIAGVAAQTDDDDDAGAPASAERTSALETTDAEHNSLDTEVNYGVYDDDAVVGGELSSNEETDAAAALKDGAAAKAHATPYAFSPRGENWWSSFDHKGWSTVPQNTWITGLWRNSCHHLYCLEMAYYSKPRIGGWGHRKVANWWGTFDRKGWSTCPHGYALTGLWRNSCHGLHCIEEGMCRKPSTGPPFTSCYTHNVWSSFDHRGLSACKPGYFIAGFWRNSCNQLHCIENFRCCTQPSSAAQQTTPGHVVKSGTWVLSKNKKIGTVKLSSVHTLSFSVFPRGNVGAWSSVLHAGNSNAQRAPGIWFYPHQTRLQVRVGRHSGGSNWKCDPAYKLPYQRWSDIVVVSTHAYTKVYINGVKHVECIANSHLLYQNSEVALWASDPWSYPAVAYIKDVKFYNSWQSSLVPKAAPKFLVKSGSWTLSKNKVLGSVLLSSAHTLSFSVFPRGHVGAWSSVVHAGLENHQHAPGIWFYPGQTRLHVRVGRQRLGSNWKCDPAYTLPIGHWSKIVVVSTYTYTKVYINGVKHAECIANGQLLYQNSEVALWASDPWSDPAAAYIKDFKFYNSLQPSLVPEDAPKSFVMRGTWTLSRANRIGTVTLSSAHRVWFSVYPRGHVGTWSSILHVGNSNTQHAPGIWFYPGQTRLQVRVGRHRGGSNWRCDPGDELPLHRWSRVEIISTFAYTKVYINDALRAHCNANSHLLLQGLRVAVWASDPWSHPAVAQVQYAHFLPQ